MATNLHPAVLVVNKNTTIERFLETYHAFVGAAPVPETHAFTRE
jgi:hypothetical protein